MANLPPLGTKYTGDPSEALAAADKVIAKQVELVTQAQRLKTALGDVSLTSKLTADQMAALQKASAAASASAGEMSITAKNLRERVSGVVAGVNGAANALSSFGGTVSKTTGALSGLLGSFAGGGVVGVAIAATTAAFSLLGEKMKEAEERTTKAIDAFDKAIAKARELRDQGEKTREEASIKLEVAQRMTGEPEKDAGLEQRVRAERDGRSLDEQRLTLKNQIAAVEASIAEKTKAQRDAWEEAARVGGRQAEYAALRVKVDKEGLTLLEQQKMELEAQLALTSQGLNNSKAAAADADKALQIEKTKTAEYDRQRKAREEALKVSERERELRQRAMLADYELKLEAVFRGTEEQGTRYAGEGTIPDSLVELGGFSAALKDLSTALTDISGKVRVSVGEYEAILAERMRAEMMYAQQLATGASIATTTMGGNAGTTYGPAVGRTVGGLIGSVFGGSEIGSTIGGVVGSIAGPALDELVSALGVLTPLFDGVADVISALQPILLVFREMAVAIGVALSQGLAPVILELARVIASILVGGGIVLLVQALAMLIVFVLRTVLGFLMFLEVLVAGARVMEQIWLNLANFIVDLVNNFSSMINALHDGVKNFVIGLGELIKSIGDPLGLGSDLVAGGEAMSGGTLQPIDHFTSVIDEFTKGIGELDEALGDNTDATDANTAGFGRELTNVPTGFKVGGAIWGSTAPESGFGGVVTGASQLPDDNLAFGRGPAGWTVIIENFHSSGSFESDLAKMKNNASTGSPHGRGRRGGVKNRGN